MKVCDVRCTLPKNFMGLEFEVFCGTVHIKFDDVVIFVADSAELTNSFTSRTSAKMSKPVRVSSALDNLAFKAIFAF